MTFKKKKNPKHPIILRTRLSIENQERFLELVKSRNSTVADLLSDAVTFYLDHHLDERCIQEMPVQNYPSTDYDDLDEGPRLPRFLWGS